VFLHHRRAAWSAAVLAAIVAGSLRGPATAAEAAGVRGMVQIPSGSFVPLYRVTSPDRSGSTSPRTRVPVSGFLMDVHPVTNGEYLEFVRTHPEWRRSRIAALFGDAAYLRHWRGDLEPGDKAPASSPVVYVSWFAARAYLASMGKRLPTQNQWEYVAAASETSRDASGDKAFLTRVREWYGRPRRDPLPPVDQSFKNIYAVRGLHDLVQEWTEDFNAALVTGESRADGARDRSLFCGSGAIGAADFEDYGAFMRYAFRGSLDARYSLASLGFRGVTESRIRPRTKR
jgi:sulfatase modifying factor 1